MSETHSPAPQGNEIDGQPTQNNPAPETTQTTPTPTTCSCPTTPSSDPGTEAQHASLISANIDAGLSGVSANVDVLGHDLADISIALGALDSVLGLLDGPTCGLVDTASGLAEGLLCDIV